MFQEQVNIKQALEQELDKIIRKVSNINVSNAPLLKGHSLALAFKEFVELSFIISAKAHENKFIPYGDMVKISGLALRYLSQQKISLNAIAAAFALWCHEKRMAITGWSLDDLEKIDRRDVTEKELGDLMYNFSPNQQMTFLGLQNAYNFFTEMIVDELYNLSEVKKDWLELLNKMQASVIEVPLNVRQGVIKA